MGTEADTAIRANSEDFTPTEKLKKTLDVSNAVCTKLPDV